MNSEKFFKLFRVGETVLVEYSGTSRAELLLYYIVNNSKLPIVVDDILDTYYEFYTRLKVAGFDVAPLENVQVIKMGGTKDIGRVIGRLNISKYVISEQEYMDIVSQLKDYPVINPVLGLHKLILLGNTFENINVVKMVSNYVGREERIAFYFVNRNVIEKHSSPILDLLEEVVTSILEITDSGIIIKKSIKDEIAGKIVSPLLNF